MRKPGVKSCSRKLRPRTSMTLLAASPPDRTSMIVAGSTPAFEHLPRARAGLRAEHEPLGDGLDRQRDDDLVARLDDLPGADRPDVHDRPAERREERLRAREVLVAAARHDGERRLAGADAPAGARRVAPADAVGAALLGDLAGDDRRDRAHVDDERAGSRAGEQA